MGNGSKFIGVLTVFLLLCVSAATADSRIDINPVDDRIVFGEKASFDVTVTNLRDQPQAYEISSSGGVRWVVNTEEDLPVLGGKQSATIRVSVEPIERFDPGVHLVDLVVTSNLGDRTAAELKVYMGPFEAKEYLPALRAVIDMSDRIDPRETQSIKIFVENLNPLNLSGLIVHTTSEIQQLEMDQVIDLAPGPGTKKTVEFTFKLPDSQQPKDYFLFVQFKRGEEIVKVIEKKFTVLSVLPPFVRDVQEDKKFLKTERKIVFTNPGNVKNTQTVILEMGQIDRLFTNADPRARFVKEGDVTALAWDIELGLNEQATITADTSYRIPVIVLIVLLVGVLLFRIYKSPLSITKAASQVTLQEGSVSGLKVTLAVKNLGSTVLKDIEIEDHIPAIAHFEKSAEMGTLTHHQVLHGKRGSTFVKWKIGELEGREERLITYKIRSKLNVVGTMQLPRAKAHYIAKSGKKKMSYSNVYRISTGE
jgi:hypothetical protein